jgi:hypothetical protein
VTESQGHPIYPMLFESTWIRSPLEHVGRYVRRADRDRETHVAVPAWLLERVANWRECGAQRVFEHDEDGPIKPMTAFCRREQGHDEAGRPDYVRAHSNGYFEWKADDVPPT